MSFNPGWLFRNARTSWRFRASAADFVRRLLFTYSARLPRSARPRDWTIGFHYPTPIGDVRLLLRANAGADAFIHSEVFEHDYYRLPLSRPPATILDLGANIGLSTIYLARLFPGARLACVEPVPGNLQVLRRNLTLNGIDAEVVPAAVDVKNGPVLMERAAKDYGHKVAAAPERSTATFEVSGLTVPSIMARLGWSRIGLLKMDIEGHEKALLSEQPGWLASVDAMCLEYHYDTAEEELTRLARRFGFRPPRRLPGEIWLLDRSTQHSASPEPIALSPAG
jgi:FkbM family methyltransferase